MKPEDIQKLATSLARLPYKKRRYHITKLLNDLNRLVGEDAEKKTRNYVV